MHYVTSGDNLIIDRKDEQYKSGAQFNLSMNSAKICGQLFFQLMLQSGCELTKVS